MTSTVIRGLAILLLGSAATYGWRLGGLALADRLPKTGRTRRFLDALPGSLLVSLAAPEIVFFGWQGIAAGGLVAGLMVVTRSTLLSAALGVLLMVGLRALG